MGRFIIKHIDNRKPQVKVYSIPSVLKENNKKINDEVMTTNEKIEMAKNVLDGVQDASAQRFKRVKKDKGLIERTESSKTVLTEDNKELLND